MQLNIDALMRILEPLSSTPMPVPLQQHAGAPPSILQLPLQMLRIAWRPGVVAVIHLILTHGTPPHHPGQGDDTVAQFPDDIFPPQARRPPGVGHPVGPSLTPHSPPTSPGTSHQLMVLKTAIFIIIESSKVMGSQTLVKPQINHRLTNPCKPRVCSPAYVSMIIVECMNICHSSSTTS